MWNTVTHNYNRGMKTSQSACDSELRNLWLKTKRKGFVKLDHSSSRWERSNMNVDSRAFEWYMCLTRREKRVFRNMIHNLSQGASFEVTVCLLSQRFNIGHRLCWEVVERFRKKDNPRYGRKFGISPQEDAKSPSPIAFKQSRNWRKKPHKLGDRQMKLAIWEAKALASKHNYRDDVFEQLLKQERRQVRAWDIVSEGIVDINTFAETRHRCIEYITNFSVAHRLQQQTTEASFVYLWRFLSLPEARAIVNWSSGIKGASGEYSLVTVAMCFLMISSKFEEVYPPRTFAFAVRVGCSIRELLSLEIELLSALKWNLLTSTPVDFLDRFSSMMSEKKTKLLSMFILELSLLTRITTGTNPTIYKPSERFDSGGTGLMPGSVLMKARPSEVALGCLILSLAYQGKACYPVKLEYCSRMRAGSVSEVVQGLHHQFRSEACSYTSHSNPILNKFLLPRFHCVGDFKPPTFRELIQHNAFRGTELAKIYTKKRNCIAQ